MEIRPVSDLHLECGDFDLEELPGDRDRVLVIAGDLGVAERPARIVAFLKRHEQRFRHIVYVPGNHEYWGGSLLKAAGRLRTVIEENCRQVTLLDRSSVLVDDCEFIGATLWTDYNGRSPVAMVAAAQQLNDYRRIRTGRPDLPYQRRIRPTDLLDRHSQDKAYLLDAIGKARLAGRKSVMITHHGISRCIATAADELDTGAYCSALDAELLATPPTLIVHGHLHLSAYFQLSPCPAAPRVVVNARGYASLGELNLNFNPNLIIPV